MRRDEESRVSYDTLALANGHGKKSRERLSFFLQDVTRGGSCANASSTKDLVTSNDREFGLKNVKRMLRRNKERERLCICSVSRGSEEGVETKAPSRRK